MPTIAVFVARHEERGGGVGHDPLEHGTGGRRGRGGQLGDERGHRGAQAVVDRPGGFDRDHDVAEPPRHIGWRTLS